MRVETSQKRGRPTAGRTPFALQRQGNQLAGSSRKMRESK